MAKSHLLLSLVRAGISGDRIMFRRAVEALIAEERGKRHEILADRLAKELEGPGLLAKPSGAEPLAVGTNLDLFYEITPNRSLEELILPGEVTSVCRDLIEEHHRHDLLRSHNLEPRHRALLIGPPGNGKTTLAECLACELMVPLIVVRYEGIIGSYLGETALRLRKLFDFVRVRPCVLFFDEFDTLGKERGDIHDTGEVKRVVSSLLLQIDALPSHVLVLTATNHSELLDRAVWRRFQVRVELPRPARTQIEQYFDRVQERIQVSLGIAPRALAQKLAGSSFSELEDFLENLLRRQVLSQGQVKPEEIARRELKQWLARVNPKKR
ncbi:MAG: AAA family ATPase [Phycisphaeraceae bacterium]|nr:AAA family ATPase [Phycisphaeraceae bacterium]